MAHPAGNNLVRRVLLVLFKEFRFEKKGVPLAAIRRSRFRDLPRNEATTKPLFASTKHILLGIAASPSGHLFTFFAASHWTTTHTTNKTRYSTGRRADTKSKGGATAAGRTERRNQALDPCSRYPYSQSYTGSPSRGPIQAGSGV